jgi:hypothetical protein
LPTKKIIPSYDFVTDLRSGLTGFELMDKYDLTPSELRLTLQSLVKARFVKRNEVYGQLRMHQGAKHFEDMRKVPRRRSTLPIVVCDVWVSQARGTLYDISEEGLGVWGIEAKVGEARTLSILPDEFGEFGVIVIEAECRWVKKEPKGVVFAGFKIDHVSEAGMEELRLLIQAHTTMRSEST